MSAATTVRDRMVEHPLVDWITITVVVGVHAAVATRYDRFDPLGAMDFSRRTELYTSALTVTGVLLGFTGAALAGYLALSGPGITAVRVRAGATLTRQWVAALTGPALALIVFFLAKVFDGPGTGGGLVAGQHFRWLAEAAALLVVLRFCRLFWVYAQLVAIANDDGRPATAAAHPVRLLGAAKRDAG